jgi:hypothetical protein
MTTILLSRDEVAGSGIVDVSQTAAEIALDTEHHEVSMGHRGRAFLSGEPRDDPARLRPLRVTLTSDVS